MLISIKKIIGLKKLICGCNIVWGLSSLQRLVSREQKAGSFFDSVTYSSLPSSPNLLNKTRNNDFERTTVLGIPGLTKGSFSRQPSCIKVSNVGKEHGIRGQQTQVLVPLMLPTCCFPWQISKPEPGQGWGTWGTRVQSVTWPGPHSCLFSVSLCLISK